MPSTIPDLFDEAVAAAPSRAWLHAEGRTFTFSEAHALVGRAASALAELGVRPGELVLATARNTPEYLFAWLGATYAGAIIVAVNPRAGENELAGLVRQVRPRLVVTDATAPSHGARVRRRDDRRGGPVQPAGRACDPAAAGPRRPGGAHPDVGHDGAVEARDADPPGLRDGR